jgi:hypothetical protein
MQKIADLSDCDFKQIARINNIDINNALCLKNDNCAYLLKNNHICFKCPIMNNKKATINEVYNDFDGGLLFPESETFKLHSRPSSKNKIFLDFQGGVLTNTMWNIYYNINSINYSAFDISENILLRIQQIWKGVVEDFAPFDVDITTEPITNYNVRCIITNNTSNEIFNDGKYGGVAFIYSWGYKYWNDCWCFNPNSKYIYDTILTISHEVGHTLGLLHQGLIEKNTITDYYEGSGDWGPIMGAAYDKLLSQWAYVPKNQTYTGTSTLPSINQDDIAIINQTLPFVPNDFPSTIQEASDINPITSQSINTYFGTISKKTDVDFFKINTGIGNITINGYVSKTDPNLNLQLTLYDSLNNKILIGTKTRLNSTINYNVTSNNSVFFVKVDGIGGNYYTDYASIGKYKIVFNLNPIVQNNFSITPNKYNIAEGENVTYNIVYNQNITLYWKNTGTSTENMFNEGSSGIININNNNGILVLNSKFGTINETKTIKIEIFSDNLFNNKIGESNIVYLNQLLNYNIISKNTSIKEGQNIIFYIDTNDNITQLYWKNIGTCDATDFVNNKNDGIIQLTKNKGILELQLKNDKKFDINKTIIIELKKSLNEIPVGVSNQVIVLDTSIPSVVINSFPLKTIKEGDNVIFTITALSVNNYTLYWTNNGTSVADDFVGNGKNGKITMNDNSATIKLITKINPKNQKPKTIKLNIRKDSISGPILTSRTITILTGRKLR